MCRDRYRFLYESEREAERQSAPGPSSGYLNLRVTRSS